MIDTNIDRIFSGQLTKDLFQKNCTYVGLTKKEFIELSNTSFRLFRAYKLKILTYKRIERLPEIDSKDLNKQILRQDDYKCIICGATNRELHVHHIVPLHRFGTNDPKNMATLCCSCHSRQHPEIKVTHNKKTKRKTKPNTTYPLSFVAFDVETTGLQAELHEIIELAAVKFIDGQHTVNFSRLVKPLSLIPNRIIQLTGITNEMVSNAPPINAVFNEFLNFISDSPLVAYNAPFDLRFIKKHMNSEMINNSVYDSLQMAKKAFPLLDDHKLGTVTRHLNLNIRKHHRSYEDSLAAGYIYLEAIKKLV